MQGEASVRLGVFVGLLVLMALWEALAPRRADPPVRGRRWPANLAFAILGGLVARVAVPGGAAAFAVYAQGQGWGLIAISGLPAWGAFLAGLAALDLAIYFQHRVFHAVPALWALHRVHHSDTMFDTTTGVRFHPIEIGLSLAIKLAVIAATGAPPEAVFAFEVLLNASSLFNHANIRMPAALERAVRMVLVTPDMHRIHHSVRREETDSNFGFSVSWWDRLFGTYRAEPADGQLGLTIGLPAYRDAASQTLGRLLLQPFRRLP
jgi:sterol desaturase/sphingolipid hydroxylase (fatty acid hydroxylase superfamily)